MKPTERGIASGEPLSSVLAALQAGSPPPFRVGRAGKIKQAHGGASAGQGSAVALAKSKRNRGASTTAVTSPDAPPVAGADAAAASADALGTALGSPAVEGSDSHGGGTLAHNVHTAGEATAAAALVPVEWAHVTCGIWVPEVHFASVEAMSPVMGLEVRSAMGTPWRVGYPLD